MSRQLTAVSAIGTYSWNGLLYRHLCECRRLTEMLRVDVQTGRLSSPVCITGDLSKTEFESLSVISRDYPIELESPFEKVDSVAGAVWRASRLMLNDDDDALLKLRFDAGTMNLPVHSHEYSDRVVVVLSGEGTFHARINPAISKPKEIPVTTGTLLAFPRGLQHTFTTTRQSLTLLSYHSPFISLDDPRQYTLG